MIPKEIIEKWELEGMDKQPALYYYSLFEQGYIQGRTDQYNEQVREIERLKGLIKYAWDSGIECHSYECGSAESTTYKTFKAFKQQHNL